MAMETELSKDIVWSLRALAQDANAQRELYPDFVVVADELVLSFANAYSTLKETTQLQQADLEGLDEHIASKSGVLEFWTDEALDQSPFWQEIRRLASEALKARDLEVSAPHPSLDTYVSDGRVWTSDRSKDALSENIPGTIFSRLLNRFR